MENPIKMDDLGVPLFLETPKWFLCPWILYIELVICDGSLLMLVLGLQQHDRPPVPVISVPGNWQKFSSMKFQGPETTCPIFFEGEETWHDGFIISQSPWKCSDLCSIWFPIFEQEI